MQNPVYGCIHYIACNLHGFISRDACYECPMYSISIHRVHAYRSRLKRALREPGTNPDHNPLWRKKHRKWHLA